MAAPTIVQTINTYLTSEFTNQASLLLKEKKQVIKKSLTAIIPMVLTNILLKSVEGKEGSQFIYEKAVEDASNFPKTYQFNIRNFRSQSKEILKNICGDKIEIIERSVSEFAHISTRQTSSLILITVPIILGLIGKHALRKKISASGLSGYLASQAGFIRQSYPVALNALPIKLGLG